MLTFVDLSDIFMPFKISDAGVVKLVDALDSKSSEGNLVRVRVPPPAPVKSESDMVRFFYFRDRFVAHRDTRAKIK